jgi:hypothetical protein
MCFGIVVWQCFDPVHYSMNKGGRGEGVEHGFVFFSQATAEIMDVSVKRLT